MRRAKPRQVPQMGYVATGRMGGIRAGRGSERAGERVAEVRGQRWDPVLEEKAPRRCSGGASPIELPSAVVTVVMVATPRTDIQADAGASAIVAAMVVAIGAPVHLFGSRCDARAVETREG